MAFKEKSQKELLKLSKDEQIKYWEEFKSYYTEQKKKLQKRIHEEEQKAKTKNKKKIDHATFVLFGALIQQDAVKNLVARMAQNGNNSFTDREKEDINLLLESRKIETRF